MLDLGGGPPGRRPRPRPWLVPAAAGVALLVLGGLFVGWLLRPAPVLNSDEVHQALREFIGRAPTAGVVEGSELGLQPQDQGSYSPDGCGLLLSPVYAPGPAGPPAEWVHGVLDGSDDRQRYALVTYLFADAEAARATLEAVRTASTECPDLVFSPGGGQGRFRYDLTSPRGPADEVWFGLSGPGRRQNVHVRQTLNAVVYQIGYPTLGPAAQTEFGLFADALDRTARLG